MSDKSVEQPAVHRAMNAAMSTRYDSANRLNPTQPRRYGKKYWYDMIVSNKSTLFTVQYSSGERRRTDTLSPSVKRDGRFTRVTYSTGDGRQRARGERIKQARGFWMRFRLDVIIASNRPGLGRDARSGVDRDIQTVQQYNSSSINSTVAKVVCYYAVTIASETLSRCKSVLRSLWCFRCSNQRNSYVGERWRR